MREIEQQIIMSEKSPAMTHPLVNYLHYDGMTEFGKDILLGQAAEIPHLGNHTERYLQELSTLTRSLPEQAQPITLE